MAQKTNLNSAPYYDDFDKDKNFVRTLFRLNLCNSGKRTHPTSKSVAVSD